MTSRISKAAPDDRSKVDPSPALVVLAINVKRLQAANPELDTDGKLAKQAKLDQKSLWRLVNMVTEPTTETLSRIASAYGLRPWQLLVPDLDPSSPPLLATESTKLKEMLGSISKTKESIEGFLRSDGNTKPGDL